MKTKSLFTLLLVVVTSVAFSAQAHEKTVRQKKNLPAFTCINASSGWDVIIRQGTTQEVYIEVNEDRIEDAKVEVKNGTLRIYTKSNKQWTFINHNNNVQKAYITVPNLEEITASGGVDIMFETPIRTRNFNLTMSGGSDLSRLTLDCEQFTANLSGGCDTKVKFTRANQLAVTVNGGSDVNLQNLSAQNCKITASGGCDLTLTGTTTQLSIIASGACDINANKLQAQDIVANFSGSADGEIYAKRSLDIIVSGSSDVTCYGNPTRITKQIDKSSSLNFE